MAGWLPLFSTTALASGTIVLNLGTAVYYQDIFPFTNIMKTAEAVVLTNDATPGVQYSSAVPKGATSIYGTLSAFDDYLDDNGDFKTSLPAGNISWNRLVYSTAAGGPDNFEGDAMTLDWSSGGAGWTVSVTATVGGNLTSGTGTTPLTFTWPTNSPQVNVYISGSGANAPKGPRLYRTASQADLNAGKHVEPEYLAETKAGAKIFRFMDWQNNNWNLTTNDIDGIPAVANGSWGTAAVNNNQNGLPLAVIVSACTEANKRPWICIPEGFTTPKMRQIYSISKSATPVVRTYGPHNFANGDKVIISTYGPFCGPLLLNPSSYSASTFTGSGVNVIANDTPIVFGKVLSGSSYVDDGSTYPTGITKGTIYWTVNATSTTFQISATPGGTAITLSGSMTGTINVWENYQASSTYGQLKRLTSYASSTWTLNNHGMVDDTPIFFGIDTVFPVNSLSIQDNSTTYPVGIEKGRTVYVKNATTNTFQTALTPGGAAMTLSGSMTGQPNIYLQLAGNEFTVANSNPSAYTFEITGPGANTLGYIGKSQMIPGVSAGHVLMPYDLASIRSKVAALVTYFKDNLPSHLTPIFELSNEIWNPQFSANLTFGTQCQNYRYFNGYTHKMIGYLMAAVADAVRIAYGTGNRSRYEFNFSDNQTSTDTLGQVYGCIAGAQQYLTDAGGGLTMRDLFNNLGMTTYMGGQLYTPNGSPVACTFGTNTVAFTGGVLGSPYKLDVDSPGGTLPTGLSKGSVQFVQTFGTLVGGSGYVDGTYTQVPLTGGAGSGLKAQTVVVSGGAVTSVTGPSQGTTSYAVGNTLGASNANLGGTGSGFSINVASISLNGNFGYPSGSGQIYWLVGTAPNWGLATTPLGSPVSFSGGSGSHTICLANQEVVNYLMQQSEALNISNPATYPNKWDYLSEQCMWDTYDNRWSNGMVIVTPVYEKFFSILWNKSRAQYYLATYCGVGGPLEGIPIIGYEGGKNNSPVSPFGFLNDPTWRQAYSYEVSSTYAGYNLTQMHNELVATGLITNQSQFFDCGAISYNYGFGDFGARARVGDLNGRWLGIVAANNL